MRKSFILRISAPAVFLLFACAYGAFALKVERLSAVIPSSGNASARGREVASGRALVKFSSGMSSAAKAGLLAGSGFKIAREIDSIGWTVIQLPEGMSVASALPVLRALSGVLMAEPDGVYRANVTPNDPLLINQYGLRKVDAFRAWDVENGSSTPVTVAVIDTGIDGSHPDLQQKLVGISQFFDPDNSGLQSPNQPPTPACSHATEVAGVAVSSAGNSVGIAGISWGAGAISLKIFNDADCGYNCNSTAGNTCGSTDAIIASAVGYAADNLQNSPAAGKIVVNMSIGQPLACSAVMQAVVDNAISKGVVLVAAAGNDATMVQSPANCLNVIPVGATDSQDNIAWFSARGAEMTARGVMAPGMGIFTTAPGSSYATLDGTSLSSPLVAGLAALIISARPSLTPSQVGNILRNSSDDLGAAGSDPLYGYGRVNAYKALLMTVSGHTADYTPLAQKSKAYAYPNPFRPGSGLLKFFVPDDIYGPGLEIGIYTAEGEKVKTLSSQTWDGNNEAGRKTASGVYLFYMETSKGSAMGKFAILR